MATANPDPESGEINFIDPEFTAHPQPVYATVLEHHRVAKTISLGLAGAVALRGRRLGAAPSGDLLVRDGHARRGSAPSGR